MHEIRFSILSSFSHIKGAVFCFDSGIWKNIQTKPRGKVVFHPGMEKSSNNMDNKAVSPRGEIFIPSVEKRDEISSRVAGMKILPCNRYSRQGGMKFHPRAKFSK